jgi:hypothetical protein
MTTFVKNWKERLVFKNGQLVSKDGDDDPVLRDGEVLRVPMMMTDSKPKEQPAISNYQVAADAHFAKTGMQSRSGSYSADVQKAREDRQSAYDKRLADAWRTNSNVGANELTPDEQAAAEEQGRKDAAARAASPNAGYDRRVSTAYKDGDAALDAARQRYHKRLEDGWKQEASQ